MNFLRIFLFLSCFCTAFYTNAQISYNALQKWEAAKYSMFIHWGIYAELGGVWEEKNISKGLSEQIQAHAGIYSNTYAKVAKRFNPSKWNADSVVMLAKTAGMRSIIITSKHHDGFCMYKSAYTDFNVVDATPYNRDVLKELSDACAKHGLSFGLYFSLIDWHYPEAMPISSHNSDSITPQHFILNKNQITELLTNYGPISELWFDMGSQTLEQSVEMKKLVKTLQPDCMIGSRLGNDMNDFVVMGDNQEPDYIIGVPWQSPASFFHETWGYRSWQERGSEKEKTREKLISLIKVTSGGGNYLLNIGPRGDGSVVEYEKNVLLEIGKWLNKNGEAIYGTNAEPFHIPFKWGYVTSRTNKLYLHVVNKPDEGTIFLPGLEGDIKNVTILSDKSVCSYTKATKGVSIKLPQSVNPAEEIKVVELTFKNGYTLPPQNIKPLSADLTLDQHNAFKYYSNSAVDYNSSFRSVVKEEWNILSEKNQTKTPVIYYTDQEKGRTIDLFLGNKEFSIKLDGDEQSPINQQSISWGPLYLAGPQYSGIEGIPLNSDNIDVSKPWGNNLTWLEAYNDMIHKKVDMNECWYILQTITCDNDQQALVSITSGDGVTVLLNGKTLVQHNNIERKENLKDIVLLELKKGKNQLLVKAFNRFKKNMTIGIDNNIPQVIYKKKLSPVEFKNGKYFKVYQKLNNPATPHQTLNLPGLKIKFE